MINASLSLADAKAPRPSVQDAMVRMLVQVPHGLLNPEQHAV